MGLYIYIWNIYIFDLKTWGLIKSWAMWFTFTLNISSCGRIDHRNSRSTVFWNKAILAGIHSRQKPYIYACMCGIHHWRIDWSSYRKWAWVTTEFRSDALTDWAIKPWVQLALRAKFEQLLQFHLTVSDFILDIAFVSHHVNACIM